MNEQSGQRAQSAVQMENNQGRTENTTKTGGRRKRKNEGDGQEDRPSEPRRLRRSHEACARCRSKKIKCDSKHPKCSPCSAAGTECNQEDRHRQTVIPRGHTERLESLLAQCDALLKRHLPGFAIENINEHLARDGIDSRDLPPLTYQALGFHQTLTGWAPIPSPAQVYIPGYPPPMPYAGYPGVPGAPPSSYFQHPIPTAPPHPIPAAAPVPAPAAKNSANGPPDQVPGQDPQANDMSNTLSLAKNFGVSAAIVNGLDVDVEREDLDVGSTGLTSGRDRAFNEVAYRNRFAPRDTAGWRVVSIRDNGTGGGPPPISITGIPLAPGSPIDVWLPKDRKMVSRIVGVYFTRLNIHRPVFFRRDFDKALDELYEEKSTTGMDPGFICSVYLILALGTLSELNHRWNEGDSDDQKHHIMPPDWPEHDEFFERALSVKPDLRVTVSSLQALILLHWYLYTERQGRTLWRLVGSLVRLAIELGLQHDPTTQKNVSGTPIFSPEECELRIRLWYIVLVHDRGTSILLGRPMAVRPEDSDVPLPVRKTNGVRPSNKHHGKTSLREEDEFSEHFELSQPIADIQADIINSLYAPYPAKVGDLKARGQTLLTNAKRIIRRMSEFRKLLPERYAWYFEGGTLGRSGEVSASNGDIKGITDDEGLTLLKLGIARILLLRAVFSARELGYQERRTALVDAIVTSHNIIVVHSELIRYPDIAFFTSPIPLHIAAMVILYGHMSKCDCLAKHTAIEDVWLALDMLPRFRWRWERKDVKGGHPLIAALAERVMEVPLANMEGPAGRSVVMKEVQWEDDSEEVDQLRSESTTPTHSTPGYVQNRSGVVYGPVTRSGAPPDKNMVEVSPAVFYPLYPEASSVQTGITGGSDQYLAMLASQHERYGAGPGGGLHNGPEGYMEEDSRIQWIPSVHSHSAHGGASMGSYAIPPQ